MRFSMTKQSSNKKTGPITVITSSMDTCPDECPMKRSECCYSYTTPWIKYRWERLTRCETGMDFNHLLNELVKLPPGSLVRYGEAGDLPGDGAVIDDIKMMLLNEAIVSARLRAWTYTHYLTNKRYTTINERIIKAVNTEHGLTINLSFEDIPQAIKHHLAGLPSTSIIPSDFVLPDKTFVMECPAVISDKVTCSNCGGKKGPLCWRKDRGRVITFRAHGSRKGRLDSILGG